MGPSGIGEIKAHAFFKEIDWEALSHKAPQPGRKRLPLEVNILESNFDRQYTRLAIKIDTAQEELIKISDPIQPTRQVRPRSKSWTWRPRNRKRHQRHRSSLRKQLPRKKLHRETTILPSSDQ